MDIPETRGRKRKKRYNLPIGEIKTFKLDEMHNLRYACKKAGWAVKLRTINGKLWAFREA